MKVCQVLLLGMATLMSGNEAVSTASQAHVLGVDTADTVQPNTHAQQNGGAKRFLRGNTPEDEIEERMNFESVGKMVEEVLPETVTKSLEKDSSVVPNNLVKDSQPIVFSKRIEDFIQYHENLRDPTYRISQQLKNLEVKERKIAKTPRISKVTNPVQNNKATRRRRKIPDRSTADPQ